MRRRREREKKNSPCRKQTNRKKGNNQLRVKCVCKIEKRRLLFLSPSCPPEFSSVFGPLGLFKFWLSFRNPPKIKKKTIIPFNQRKTKAAFGFFFNKTLLFLFFFLLSLSERVNLPGKKRKRVQRYSIEDGDSYKHYNQDEKVPKENHLNENVSLRRLHHIERR